MIASKSLILLDNLKFSTCDCGELCRFIVFEMLILESSCFRVLHFRGPRFRKFLTVFSDSRISDFRHTGSEYLCSVAIPGRENVLCFIGRVIFWPWPGSC